MLLFQIGLGLLLLAGLWTPVAGTLAAVLALWRLFSQIGEPWIQVLLATLGVALALLGPASGRSTLACLDGSGSTSPIASVALPHHQSVSPYPLEGLRYSWSHQTLEEAERVHFLVPASGYVKSADCAKMSPKRGEN